MARRAAPEPRSAVVTGAASGIGAGMVARLRERGVPVVAADRDPAVATRHAGATGVVPVVADVTDAADTAGVVALAEERHGPVDLLVHCAAVMPAGAMADVPADEALRVMTVNYGGTVRMLEAVLPSMRARRTGQVVVLGSLAGYLPMRRFAAYSASKAAVNLLVETVAQEEEPHGVHVMLVAPVGVKTPLLAQASDGPALVRRMAVRDRALMMVTPQRVLDEIEAGLRRGRRVVVPGGRLAHLARRLAPGFVWAVEKRL